MVSKYFLVKGIKSFWRNSWFQVCGRKCTNEHGKSYPPQNKKATKGYLYPVKGIQESTSKASPGQIWDDPNINNNNNDNRTIKAMNGNIVNVFESMSS